MNISNNIITDGWLTLKKVHIKWNKWLCNISSLSWLQGSEQSHDVPERDGQEVCRAQQRQGCDREGVQETWRGRFSGRNMSATTTPPPPHFNHIVESTLIALHWNYSLTNQTYGHRLEITLNMTKIPISGMWSFSSSGTILLNNCRTP